ncbi:MAG: type II secretion system secretin GspD [Burkholderiaceae bacterium]|jgi:general secretion pathway protein D|nr:type II secretion system secretin GspD [Burkholderiaceae bacterium]
MNLRPSLLFFALLASGCATVDTARQNADSAALPPAVTLAPRAVESAASGGGAAVATAAPAATARPAAATGDDAAANIRLYPGDDGHSLQTQLSPPKPDPVLTHGERVSLNFENIPVASLATALLGDLLKLNYTVDAGGEVVVSLRTSQPLPRNQVLDVLDAVLLPHDLAINRDSAGVYHVTKRAATAGARPVVASAQLASLAGSGTVIVPLNYIAAAEMAKILTPLAPKDSIVYVDNMRNLLVLQGSKVQLAGWLEMVNTFDVDFLSGMSLGVFILENANIGLVYDTLQSLLSSNPSASMPSAAPAINVPGGRGAYPQRPAAPAMPGAASALGGAGALYGMMRVIPIERLNALVVITPRRELLRQAELWIRRLDLPSDAQGSNLYVYPVQNGSATRLAETLNGLFNGQAASAQTGIAAGAAPTQFGRVGAAGTNSNTGSLSSATSTLPGLGNLNATQQQTQAALTVSQLEGNVRIVADEERNALLIYAPRNEYRRIEKALRELDKAPRQVLIEATIVDVSLNDDLKYGVEWYLHNSLGGGRNGVAGLNFSGNPDLTASALQQGFSYTVVGRGGAVSAVINALAAKSLVRVLSSPSVLVLDNHTANILVGKQQPIKTGTTYTGTGIYSDNITYKDTGVMLTVTPSVNSGGLITMNIAQQVTDVSGLDAATSQSVFTTRQIQSRVAVRSGETVVLGGMISENGIKARNGVPLLSEIPLFGALFSKTENTSLRTELIVLLTPRALENDDDLRSASLELRQRMRSLSMQALPYSFGDITREKSPEARP